MGVAVSYEACAGTMVTSKCKIGQQVIWAALGFGAATVAVSTLAGRRAQGSTSKSCEVSSANCTDGVTASFIKLLGEYTEYSIRELASLLSPGVSDSPDAQYELIPTCSAGGPCGKSDPEQGPCDDCDGFEYGQGSCFKPPPEVLAEAMKRLTEVEYNEPDSPASKPRVCRVYHNRRKTAWTDYPFDEDADSLSESRAPTRVPSEDSAPPPSQPSALVDLLKSGGNVTREQCGEIVCADAEAGSIGAVLKATDIKGWSPLLIAVQRKHLAAVGALLELRADVECKEPQSGWTPLMYAAMSSNRSIVQQLLSHGASVNVRVAQRNWSPLCAAIQSGDATIVGMLMTAGADIQAVKKFHPDLAETYATEMQ